MVEPATGNVVFFCMVGHSFGLVSAVYNFNRRAALITDFMVRLFLVPAKNYYDDKSGFALQEEAANELAIVTDLHAWLGVDFAQDKLQCSAAPVILGATYDLSDLVFKVTEERKVEMRRVIQDILDSGRLSPAWAAKVKRPLGEHILPFLGALRQVIFEGLQCATVRRRRRADARLG